MLNYIWLAMLIIAVVVGGFTGKLPDVTAGAFEGAERAVMKVALPLLGVWAIWLGIMRLAERSGLVQALASALRPVMRWLFPDVPAGHPAVGAMVMNMAANMLGLGNAATPLGLRAMRLLESLNPRPGTATNAMCVFLTINTASIQILPLTVIGILATQGAKNPTAIVAPALLASIIAAAAGVFAAKLLEKLPMFRLPPAGASTDEPGAPATDDTAAIDEGEKLELERIHLPPLKPLHYLVIGVYLALFVAMGIHILKPLLFPTLFANLFPYWFSVPADAALPEGFKGKSDGIQLLMTISMLAIPFLLSFFPLYATLRGVKVYEQFVEGAKEAWDTARRTIPYLVAMLVGIAMLQKAGVIELLTQKLTRMLNFIHFPAELLPLVLMRPLSGSASNGIFIDLVQHLKDPDGMISRMAAVINGSSETTFYVIAIYFGSVSIRRTRHAVAAGLFADLVAVVASIALCRVMFG